MLNKRFEILLTERQYQAWSKVAADAKQSLAELMRAATEKLHPVKKEG